MMECILSCLLILFCWIQAGFCFIQTTIPDSGTNIVGDLGDENIMLFCELTQDGMKQATIWALMREGQIGQTAITVPDPNFVLTGDPLTNTTGFFLNTNLTILEVTEDLNNAILYCGVPETPLAANFTIRLYTPPTLIHRGVIDLAEGDTDSVDLSNTTVAEAIPFPVGDQITWTRDGGAVSSDSRVTYGYPSVMFNAPGVQRSDAGTYQLSATNTRPDGSVIGNDTGNFTLVVYFGPLITPGDDRVPVEVRGDVTLVCGTGLDSNPASSIVWRDNNDVEITNGGRYTFGSGPSEVSLRIAGVTANDAGDWRCTVTVMAGVRLIGTHDRSITLFVVVPAATPTDVIAREVAGTAILVCWQQSSDVGTAGVTRYRIYVERADISQPIDTPDNETFFNVTRLLPVTEYTFRVQAVTEYQGITVRSNISDPGVGNTTVSAPAPVCDVRPVSANGVITVTWGYTHTGGLEITEVIVQYGIHSSGPIDFQDIPNGNLTDPSQQTLVVSGLIAGKAYVFRVTASNNIGPASVDCLPVIHFVGVPQTPEVVMVETAGGGDVDVSVRIPSDSEFNISSDTVTFTVTATLVSSGAEVISTDRNFDNYRYGMIVVVEIRGQVLTIGDNYRFAVTVSNRFGSSGTSQPVTMEVDDTPMTPTSPARPTSTIPRPEDGSDGSIIGGAVGGAVGGAIVITVALIIIIIILKKQHAKQWHPESLPDLPLTSNVAYNIVSTSGPENDPNVSPNIAYHTTQTQDMDTFDYDTIETAGVVAPGSFTVTSSYEYV